MGNQQASERHEVNKDLCNEGVLGEDYVMCPVCGKHMKRITLNHLKKHGIVTFKEFSNIFPEAQKDCKAFLRGNSIASKIQWSSPEKREEMLRLQLEAQEREDVRRRKSEKTRSSWLNPEIRKRRINGLSEAFKNLSHIDRMFQSYHWEKYRSVDGFEVNMRSSYEVKLAKSLSMIGLNFEYETKVYPYTKKDGTIHNYIVDFYINDLDLLIEVKPESHVEDEYVEVKLKAVRDMNLNIIMLNDSDINGSVDKLKLKLIASTTNRDIDVERLLSSRKAGHLTRYHNKVLYGEDIV